MYCGKCGAELSPGSKYCGKCGAPVNSSGAGMPCPPDPPADPEKRPTAIIRIVIAMGAVILTAILGGLIYRSMPAQRASRQVTLGDRYMAEMDYSRAMAAYEEAISVDPKNVAAYSGLLSSAESYVTFLTGSGEANTQEQDQEIAATCERVLAALDTAEKSSVELDLPENKRQVFLDILAQHEDPAGTDPAVSSGRQESSPENPAEGQQPEFIEVYQDLLEQYRTLTDQYRMDDTTEDTPAQEGGDPLINYTAVTWNYTDYRMIYALYDIDGNGIPELLIGSGHTYTGRDPYILAVYTEDGKSAVPLRMVENTYASLRVYQNGEIMHTQYESGGGKGRHDFYRMNTSGTRLDLIRTFESNFVDYVDTPYLSEDERLTPEEFQTTYLDQPEIRAVWVFLDTPLSDYMESVPKDWETEEGLALDGTDWRHAYLSYILSDPDVDGELTTFAFLYGDDDTIPEIAINYGYGLQDLGTRILSYHDGRIDTYTFLREGGIQYVEKGGLFYNAVGHAGLMEDQIASLDREGFHSLGSGFRNYDQETLKDIYFSWEGQEVSEEAYRAIIRERFPDDLPVSEIDASYYPERIRALLQ